MTEKTLDRLRQLADVLPDFDYGTFEQIINLLPDGLLIVDADGKILLVNRQVELTFGYHRSELLGHHFHLFLPQDLRDVHDAHFANYKLNPTTRWMNQARHLKGLRKDGITVTLQISIGPLPTPRGMWFMALIRDIERGVDNGAAQ